MGIFKALWAYRGFILGSVKREFQSKYRNSLLGAAWTILNPLAMIVVYTVIFAQVMRAKLPGVDSTFAYSIYLCAGVLTWGLFAEIAGRAQGIFLEHANLLKIVEVGAGIGVSDHRDTGSVLESLATGPERLAELSQRALKAAIRGSARRVARYLLRGLPGSSDRPVSGIHYAF